MNSASPLVSVIIPAYNREKFIGRAIKSVLTQTFSDLEVIVVDDCSTDGTAGLASEFSHTDNRVHLIRQQSNAGAQAARYRGIQVARGAYIGFLDSDDEWLPQKLEKQMVLFERGSGDLGVVYGGFTQVYSDGRSSVNVIPFARGEIYMNALSGWIADMNTLLVRREEFEKLGRLNETVRAFQEWAFCIQLAKHCNFDFVPEPLAIYNIHGSTSISTNLLVNAQGYLDVINLFKLEIETEVGKSVLASHYHTAGRLFTKADDYIDAQDCFWRAINIRPFTMEYWMHMFFARLGSGYYPKAARLKRWIGALIAGRGN
jgi:glycosyltransferase involved in cell wall biosynthesis